MILLVVVVLILLLLLLVEAVVLGEVKSRFSMCGRDIVEMEEEGDLCREEEDEELLKELCPGVLPGRADELYFESGDNCRVSKRKQKRLSIVHFGTRISSPKEALQMNIYMYIYICVCLTDSRNCV